MRFSMNTRGFTLLDEQNLSETGGTVRWWRHEATGAELLSVLNSDENKCFGVSFRTPPSDSTGVAHILEHSVLCGSDKYPSKEPFVTLLKGSLQTFLNAFTFPDKTCYPVASANLQDFRNLVDVYLDAVFFPRISENTFRQEGWHLEPSAENPLDGPLSYQGVVFNEMKGVYSSPDSLLSEKSQQALFPGHVYGLDSGGEPSVIPSLTYADFRAFHHAFYHPGNACFFFWGDDPEEGRFDMLEPYLARFTRGQTAPAVPLQTPPETPRLVEVPYAAEGDDTRGHITMNWLLPETSDIALMLTLDALEHILQGLPGSPLRKALIESGLGEDITGDGLGTDLRQAYYSVGLRSINPADAPAVETLILDTLAGLAESGIPASAVEAAMNSLEFHLRENNTGSFPRGLAAMVGCLAAWLHGGDPVRALAWEKPLNALKTRLAAGEKVFEDTIRRYFLENNPTTVLLLPDPSLASRRAAAERAALDAIQATMDEGARTALVHEAEALHAAQEAPDRPEDIAAIPALTVADLPRQNASIPSELVKAGGIPALTHELPTTGIVYASLLLPMDAVPAELMPLVPLYGRALTELGTKRHTFVEFGTAAASRTGGIGAGPLFATHRENCLPIARLTAGGKATAEKAADLFDLMREMLLEPNFDNRDRFTRMVLEERARLEQGLIPAGHRTVSDRLRARQSVAGWLNELTGGVTYLEAARVLASRLEHDWAGVLNDLEHLHSLITRSDNAMFNITADASGMDKALKAAEKLAGELPKQSLPAAVWTPPVLPEAEALLIPAQVNYVGAGANLYETGYRWHASASVIARHLRMDWLWNQVRVKGGAYGAFFSLDRITGAVAQVSYRDPHIDETLEAYAGTAGFLRQIDIAPHDLELAIVGAVGDIDTYQLPDAKGGTALARFLTGDTDDYLQTLRDEVFATTPKHFRAFGEALAEAFRHPSICVLGGDAASDAAKRHGWTARKLL